MESDAIMYDGPDQKVSKKLNKSNLKKEGMEGRGGEGEGEEVIKTEYIFEDPVIPVQESFLLY